MEESRVAVDGCLSITSATSSQSGSEILKHPNQPRQKFPAKKFGKQYRSFNSKWFDNDKWSPWLYWDNHEKKAFCFICKNIHLMHQLTLSKNVESAFISSGFENWKRATSAMTKQMSSGVCFEWHHQK